MEAGLILTGEEVCAGAKNYCIYRIEGIASCQNTESTYGTEFDLRLFR